MSHRILLIIFCLTITFAAVACHSAKPPVIPAQDAVKDYPNIVLHPDLRHRLVTSAPSVIAADGTTPLRIRVPIRSVSDQTLGLEYRVMYFDDQQQPLTKYPAWRQITLMPRSRHIISSNAISLQATDWNIEIRQPH